MSHNHPVIVSYDRMHFYWCFHSFLSMFCEKLRKLSYLRNTSFKLLDTHCPVCCSCRLHQYNCPHHHQTLSTGLHMSLPSHHYGVDLYHLYVLFIMIMYKENVFKYFYETNTINISSLHFGITPMWG